MEEDVDDAHEVDLAQVVVRGRVHQALERDHERLLDAELIDAAIEGEQRQEGGQAGAQAHVVRRQRTVVHDEELGEELGRQNVSGHEELAEGLHRARVHVALVVIEQARHHGQYLASGLQAQRFFFLSSSSSS